MPLPQEALTQNSQNAASIQSQPLHEPISAAEVLQPLQDGFLKLLRKEPALGLSLGYLFLTAVGITYDYWYYLFFRINILDYADFSDFLFAAIREPIVIVLTILSSLVILLYQEFDYKLRTRFPQYNRFTRRFMFGKQSPIMQRFWVISAIILYFGGIFTPYYASYVSSRIRAGKARRVRVELISEPNKNTSQNANDVFVIGTTSRFVMIYSNQTKTPIIIPISNIARITVLSPLPSPLILVERRSTTTPSPQP